MGGSEIFTITAINVSPTIEIVDDYVPPMYPKHEDLEKNNVHQPPPPHESEDDSPGGTATLQREIKFRHGFAFVVGGIIGAGIFVTPSFIARQTENLFVTLLAWIVAGIISLMGSLCFCEMTSIVKKTGGSYVFILDCYGSLAGFLVTWTNVFFFSPFTVCLTLMTLGKYACASFFEDHSSSEYIWASKGVGISILLILAVVNCLGPKNSGTFQLVFTVIQLIIFGVIFGLAIHYLVVNGSSINHFEPNIVFNGTLADLKHNIPKFGTAVFNALYCYAGYIYIAFIIEEVENPKRTIPLLSYSSIPFVAVMYVLITLATACVLTHQELADSEVFLSNFAVKIGMDAFAYMVPLFVAICMIPALSSMMHNFPQLTLSAAREGHLPKFLSLIHKKRHTPIPAICLLTVMAIILTVVDFEMQTMLQVCNITIWFEYAIAISTLVVNRWRKPNVPRVYKTWLTTPIVMVIIPITLVILTIYQNPYDTVVLLVLMILGLPIYYVCIKKHWVLTRANNFTYAWLIRNTSFVKCVANMEQ